jgi:hypothetical protein
LGDKSDEQFHIERREGGSIKVISDHLKKHTKPSSDEEFGYYLAGLIEADSRINEGQLEIILNEKDPSLAYFIKKYVGFGVVRKYSNYIKYILVHTEGLKRVLTLINGKFLTKTKIDQLLEHGYDQKYGISILPPSDFDITQNHFFTGFCDIAGYFRITPPKDIDSHLVKLHFYVETKPNQQRDSTILQKVKSAFGGQFNLDEEKGIYHYEASSFSSNFKTTMYFDRFQLNSCRSVDYFKWRKAYRIIQRGEHLTHRGLEKLIKLRKTIQFKPIETRSLN